MFELEHLIIPWPWKKQADFVWIVAVVDFKAFRITIYDSEREGNAAIRRRRAAYSVCSPPLAWYTTN